MPDTAIDPNAALAPPPGWTPPSSPTPMDVNPATMGGTPQLPPPTQPNVTAQDPSSSAYAPTIGATDPELAAGHAHQSWLGHIMDVVGSILGGDQTIHVTKSPDGTMTVTHDPSTSAEKWGRVAQAALMGGAAGLANGQGPGGTARAVAAGVQAGAQQQPQQLAQANQQAAASNTQLLASANNALLHQKLVQAGLESQQLGMTVGKEQADLLNGMADASRNSPNAQVLPSVGSMDEIMKLKASYADFFKTHTNNQMKVFVTPDAQGKVRFTPVIVDTAYNDRLNDHPEQSYSVDVDPDTHEPILKVTGIPVGSQPQGQIDAAKQANALKYLTTRNQWLTASAGADKKSAPGVPKSAQEALAMAAIEKDPALKQAYTDLAPQMQKMEVAQKAAGRAPAAPTSTAAPGGIMGAEFGGGDPNSTFERNAQMLAHGDQVLSQIRIMRGKGQPTQQDYVARADQIDRAEGGQGYLPAQVGIEYKNANEQKTQDVIKAIDRAIGRPGTPGQIDQLINLSDKAHLSNAPLIGGLINRGALNAGNVAGDKDAQNLLNSIEDTRATFSALIGNPLLGGGETDKKLERAQRMIGNFPTPDNLRSAKNDVLVPALQTQRDAITGSNRFLRRQYGTSTELSPMERARQQQPTPTPTPTPTPSPTPTPTPTPTAAPTAQELQRQAAAAGVPNDGHAYIVGGKIVGYFDKTNAYHGLGAR